MTPNQEQVSEMIRKMDKNRNGKVEFEEFRAVMEEKIESEILSDEDTMEDLR